MRQKFGKLSAAAMAIFLGVVAFGCAPASRGAPEPPAFERLAREKLPPDVREWVDISREIYAGQVMASGDRTYILATLGEERDRWSGIKIDGVELQPGELRVTVRLCAVAGEAQDYDIVAVRRTGLPVNFAVTGVDWGYLMQVVGTDRLRPIVARSRWVKLFSPDPARPVGRTFEISGVASVFEGQLDYVVRQGEQVLARGFMLACMGDWGYFSAEVRLPETVQGELRLEIFSDNPAEGRSDLEISLRLEIGR